MDRKDLWFAVFPRRTRAARRCLGTNRLQRPAAYLCRGGGFGKNAQEVFSAEDRSGIGHFSTMHRAIIMSGFLQSEVHTLMTAFRQAGLPRQLWATVTPVSENWTLAALFD